jgi:hypothetical protein
MSLVGMYTKKGSFFSSCEKSAANWPVRRVLYSAPTFLDRKCAIDSLPYNHGTKHYKRDVGTESNISAVDGTH